MDVRKSKHFEHLFKKNVKILILHLWRFIMTYKNIRRHKNLDSTNSVIGKKVLIEYILNYLALT